VRFSRHDDATFGCWQGALIVHGMGDPATIALVQDHQEDYLSLSWF
jgi:hypothetical protein